jgi:hypothetical protein
MRFDQIGSVVIKAQQGANGQWEVGESGFEKPPATFETADKAFDYANHIAKKQKAVRALSSRDRKLF